MSETEAVAKGWFITDERTGDRTLAQQMTGLERLLPEVVGKSVLDIGCAEGLIAIEMGKRGAADVLGIEIIPGHVEMAERLSGLVPCWFAVRDANTYQPDGQFDIVLLLSILHKLVNPSKSCKRFADACKDLCVIRLPPGRGPMVIDWRSNERPHDIGAVMAKAGFKLEHEQPGHLDEWIGYYRRVKV